jgi:hypothetical protein
MFIIIVGGGPNGPLAPPEQAVKHLVHRGDVYAINFGFQGARRPS